MSVFVCMHMYVHGQRWAVNSRVTLAAVERQSLAAGTSEVINLHFTKSFAEADQAESLELRC